MKKLHFYAPTIIVAIMASPAFADDNGVKFIANYTGEAAANTSGGIRQSEAFAGQVLVGAEFDMAKLAGIKGGKVKLYITNRHGENLQEKAIGNNTSVQEIYGTQNTHLAVFSWEQKLLNDRLTIEAGRLPANITFLGSDYYCNFQGNSVCGNPTFVFKTTNFTYWPASSWGAHAKYWFNDKLYIHVGAYEVNPERKTIKDHGIDFGTSKATGMVYPWEFGYSVKNANYRIGGVIDKGDYEDPYFDINGNNRILTGKAAQTHNGRSNIFARFDQIVWTDSAKPSRNLAVFGVAMTKLSGHLAENSFLDFGIVKKGTFMGRDDDTLGFVISHQDFSNATLSAIREARISAGGNGDIPESETMIELAYGAQVSPQVRISPNLQYIHNPDQNSTPFRKTDIKDAFVIGFKFTFDPLAK